MSKLLYNLLGYKPNREAHILFNKIAKLVKRYEAEISVYNITKNEHRYKIELVIKKDKSIESIKSLDIKRKL